MDLDNIESVEDIIANLEAKVKEHKESELRAYAELENFKRRKEQEKTEKQLLQEERKNVKNK